MGETTEIRPTEIKGTRNHVNASFSTEMFAGAMISVVHYLAPLRYSEAGRTRSSVAVLRHGLIFHGYFTLGISGIFHVYFNI
jgi:hypothetical protein